MNGLLLPMPSKYQVNALLNRNPSQSKKNYLAEIQKTLEHARCYPLSERVSNFLRSFINGVAEHPNRRSMND